ncbi:hypothetical protein F8S13_20275 [Chloroflexia bacterium SDU3-3]|nr:hypothetical protein F8S13_20275 [Chloroflexia bacterium SDU3-3]
MADNLPSLHSPPSEALEAVDRILQDVLRQYGYQPRRLAQVLRLMAMLLPTVRPEAIAALVLQSMWVYAVDALVDGFAPDLDTRFRRWLEHPLEPNPDDAEHRLFAAMWSHVRSLGTPQGCERWQQALEVFLSAQLREHTPPQSYLDYLDVRVIANGLPSLAALAALLQGELGALDTARTANLVRWGGIFTSLANDLHSYDRELAEGTAATANALGVLMGLAARQGGVLDLVSARGIVQADCDAALHMFDAQLGGSSQWSALDGFIARAVGLVRHGHVV